MYPSFLLLETYFIEELRFAVNREYTYDPEKGIAILPEHLKFDVKSAEDEDEARKWLFQLSVETEELTKANLPYSFLITLVGVFEIKENQPYKSPEKLIQANAP